MFPGETVLSQGDAGKTNPHNGEFKVIQSQGSRLFYIGTMFLSCGVADCSQCGEYNEHGRGQRTKGEELDFNSRETDYFKTKKEAEDALEEYKKTEYLPGQRC